MAYQTSQPFPTQGMTFQVDPRNKKGIPMGPNGRAWSYGLCSCFGDCGTCCISACCPCVTYSINKSRREHLSQKGSVHPQGGDACTGDCFLHAFLSCWGFGWVLQMTSRGQTRERYRIEGGTCGDCCSSWCCHSCELTQESREIELEEDVLLGRK